MQHRTSSSRRRFRYVGRTLAAIAIGTGLGACGIESGGASNTHALPQVPVATPLVQRVAVPQLYPAQIEAIDRVELRSRVSGYVESILFTEGALVEKGQPLLRIDPKPYVAKLNEAEASLVRAQAEVELARQEHERAVRLAERKAVSMQELDQRSGALQVAVAQLAAARAARDLAALDLSYTEVHAPIAGRIGRAEVTPGNLVTATTGSATLLATLVSIDPIYATFDIEEGAAVELLGAPADLPPVGFRIPGGEELRYGRVSFIDNEFGRRTGTLRIRATLPNPDGRLMPGLLGNVSLAVGGNRESLLIDDKAIGTDQGHRYVLVANDRGELEYRPIQAGALYNGLRIVADGLDPHDRVVVNGLMRVRPGLVVEPITVVMEQAAVGNYTPVEETLVAASE